MDTSWAFTLLQLKGILGGVCQVETTYEVPTRTLPHFKDNMGFNPGLQYTTITIFFKHMLINYFFVVSRFSLRKRISRKTR